MTVTTKHCVCWCICLAFVPVQLVIGEERRDPFFVPRPELYQPRSEVQVDGVDRSRPSVVRQIGLDFKSFVTRRDNLVILGVGLGAAWGAGRFDQNVASSGLNSELGGDGASLDHVFESGEIAGSGYAQAALAAATFGLGKLSSKPGVEELGRDLVRAQVLATSVTFAIKHAVGRERPDGSSTTSFPSGHTSSSFATATVLHRRYGWRVGLPAYAFAGYVAGSRLNEGKHYISDVIFGAAIGIVSGRSVTFELVEERFAIAPLLVPGGAGARVTWLGPSSSPR